jgi:hypothetical protein
MPEDIIPIGFSSNDFFYKNVNTINMDGNRWGIGTTNDLCSKDITDLKYLVKTQLDNLNLNIDKQPTNSNYDNGNITPINTNSINNDEIVNKIVEYYLAVCKNEKLAKKIMEYHSDNANGELQYNDSMNSYEREYLNRINLGLGIIVIIGIIYFIKSIPKTISNIPLSK